jgi:hypothetical protein
MATPVEMTSLFWGHRDVSMAKLRFIATNLSSRPERTRISCHAALDATTRAAFIKESRMKFASATNLNRKSGVAQWRDLRWLSGIKSSLSPVFTKNSV